LIIDFVVDRHKYLLSEIEMFGDETWTIETQMDVHYKTQLGHIFGFQSSWKENLYLMNHQD
jgi:hypothetical protein